MVSACCVGGGLMGRPSVLTKDVHVELVAYARKGVPRSVAAKACRISKNVIRNWETRGEEGEEPYATFIAEYNQAAAEFRIDLIEAIRNAKPALVGVSGADPWQAQAWLLERLDPENFSQKINQHKRETEDAILAKLRAHPKLHAEVAHVLAAEEDPASGTAPSH